MATSVLLAVLEGIGHLITFICIIFAIRGNYKIYKVKHEMFIRKRSISIIFGINAAMILNMFALSLGVISTTFPVKALDIIADASTNVCWWLFIYFINTKSWMIFYQQRWTFYTLKFKWQHIINNKKDGSDNFYIKHHTTYGKLSYIYKLFAIFHGTGLTFAVFGIVSSHLQLIPTAAALSLIGCFFTLAVIFYIVIICKTERTSLEDDIFYIHWESKLLWKLLLLILFMFMIFSTVSVLINDIHTANIIFLPILVAVPYMMVHLSTYSIYKKCYHPHDIEYETSVHSISADSPRARHRFNSNASQPSSPKITLKQILSDDLSIHLFMLHLSKEYSMECLLSYIELTQFQQIAVEYINENETNANGDNQHGFDQDTLNLPSHLPTSSAIAMEENVGGSEDVKNLKIKAHKLYNKYLKIGCEFEINIGHKERMDYKSILEDKHRLINNNGIKIRDIYERFEKSRKEMTSLMQFSFERFRKTDEFDTVITKFSSDQDKTI